MCNYGFYIKPRRLVPPSLEKQAVLNLVLEYLYMFSYYLGTAVVCSFVFTCSFGRKSNVRSEQTLRSGCVALEYVHI